MILVIFLLYSLRHFHFIIQSLSHEPSSAFEEKKEASEAAAGMTPKDT